MGRALASVRRRGAGAVALAVCCAAGMAQPTGQADRSAGARRIEAGTTDRDPSRTSLRSLQADLRAPTGFEGVYQIDRVDALGGRETSFMRIDGNLHAVFPRSVYARTSRGSVAVVPPGTTFFIGAPPSPPTPARDLRHRSGFVDLSLPSRAEVRAGASTTGAAVDVSATRGGAVQENASVPRERGTPGAELSLFESEAYHGYRVADLLLRARAAEKRGEGATLSARGDRTGTRGGEPSPRAGHGPRSGSGPAQDAGPAR